MTLASAFLVGINRMYEIGGVPASYTDKDSNSKSLTALIDYDLSQYGDVAEVAQATATISIRVSELEFAPRRGETIEADSRTFVVSDLLRADELEHTVLAS